MIYDPNIMDRVPADIVEAARKLALWMAENNCTALAGLTFGPTPLVAQLEKTLADSQQQVWGLQNGLRALIDGTLLDDAGNRGENGLRDWVRRSSTPETVVNHWLEVAVRTLVQGSK